MSNDRSMNGFSVSGFVLALISILNVMEYVFRYVYVVSNKGLGVYEITSVLRLFAIYDLFMNAGYVVIVSGFIFSLVGLLSTKKHPEYSGKTLSIVGLVLSSLSVAVVLLFIFVVSPALNRS